jgi:hypothetical protein
MVEHFCNSRDMEHISRRIMVQGQPGESVRPHPESNESRKRLKAWLNLACLASTKP